MTQTGCRCFVCGCPVGGEVADLCLSCEQAANAANEFTPEFDYDQVLRNEAALANVADVPY